MGLNVSHECPTLVGTCTLVADVQQEVFCCSVKEKNDQLLTMFSTYTFSCLPFMSSFTYSQVFRKTYNTPSWPIVSFPVLPLHLTGASWPLHTCPTSLAAPQGHRQSRIGPPGTEGQEVLRCDSKLYRKEQEWVTKYMFIADLNAVIMWSYFLEIRQ